MEPKWREFVYLCVRVIVSFVFLVAAPDVILSNKYPDATTKWAFGLIGVVERAARGIPDANSGIVASDRVLDT